MTSPAISLAGQANASVTFSYHMYGASNMGGLVLEASPNGSSWSTVWSRNGNQGNTWSTSSVDLGAYTGGNVYLRFVGTTGSTWQGDMCVDAITVTNAAAALAGIGDSPIASAQENFLPEFDIQVYPNPAITNVSVRVGGFEGAEYTITNLQGQVITTGNIASDELNLDVSAWASGMYIITVGAEDQRITRQIIKE